MAPMSVWDHSRRYAIYRGNDLLGTTNLEYVVTHGERVAGRFHPAWQFRRYESIFNLYSNATDEQALRRYKKQRDELNLEVWDSGILLDARVDLVSQWSPRQWMMHVSVIDKRFWSTRGRS
jgi:hypothetical protein